MLNLIYRQNEDGSIDAVKAPKGDVKTPAAYIDTVFFKQPTAESTEAKAKIIFLAKLENLNCLYCLDTGFIHCEMRRENGVKYTFSYSCLCSSHTLRVGKDKQPVCNASIGEIAAFYYPKCGVVRDGSGPTPEYHPENCKVTHPQGQCLTMIRNGHCPKFSDKSTYQPRERADLA